MASKSFFERRNDMNKKLLELLNAINTKKMEVRNLVDEGRMEEAKVAKEELIELQNKFDLLKDLEEEGLKNMQNRAAAGTANTTTEEEAAAAPEEPPKDAVHEFANAARNRFHVSNDMSEGSRTDGGYTVPEDIQTKINERREARASLIQFG